MSDNAPQKADETRLSSRRTAELELKISDNENPKVSELDTEEISSTSSISEDFKLKVTIKDSISQQDTEKKIVSDQSSAKCKVKISDKGECQVHQQDKEETSIPGPNTVIYNPKRMLHTLKTLSKSSASIINELEKLNPSNDFETLKTLEVNFSFLSTYLRNLMGLRDCSFDISRSVASEDNSEPPVPAFDNMVSNISLGSSPSRSEVSERLTTSTNEQNRPPTILFNVTQLYTFMKQHESLSERFRLALQRIQPPAFPVWHIESQKVLISLFLHLLQDYAEFIEFLLGKEEVSTSDQLSNEDEAKRLAFVKDYFASFTKQKEIGDKIDSFRRKIEEIRPQVEESCSNEERCFEYRYSVKPLRDFILVIGSNPDLYKSEISEEWLKFIRNLYTDAVALAVSCRDTTRAIVDYLYQLKLGILNSPRFDDFLDNLLSFAVSFLEIREEYNNLMCCGFISKYFHLHVKIKIAYRLKDHLMSILCQNSKFWDIPQS